MTKTYVALDLETTGLNPSNDRILEIGAVKVINGKITDTYETMVNPGIKISAHITSLTGITDEMAAVGKDTRTAVTELLAFCGEFPLLGHNVLFDYSFVKRTTVNLNLPFERAGIDTLKIARVLHPELESRSLEALCKYYKIEQKRAHRAVDDAMAAIALYKRMREGCSDDREELFEPKPLVCKFKKQGPITAAQKSYLNDLVKYHKIALEVCVDTLTKNEASRMIDKIILEKGRIQR